MTLMTSMTMIMTTAGAGCSGGCGGRCPSCMGTVMAR
jgi:hypothetical protein